MKKTIYSISLLVFITAANTFGQKPVFELTFTAANGGLAVILDSINIENLTQGGDTTLYAPESVLVLDFATGIDGNNENGTNQFSVSQNCPNPFDGQTVIHLNVPENDIIAISIFDLLGHEVANYSNVLDAGNHSFVFFAGKEKYYLFTATGSRGTQCIKMMNLSNGETQAKLVYQGNDGNTSSLKSQKAVSDFIFSLGDQLRFIGYSNTLAGIHGSDVMEDAPQSSQTYQFSIIEGIPCPDIPNVTYEGQTYKTIQIGSQCWFKENLNVGTMVNGSGDQTNNGIIEKYCFGNHPDDCNIYGGLYQWNEVMGYSTTPGVQGICPIGWHLPTDNEFCTLATFIDPSVYCDVTGYFGIDGGGKMKSIGTIEAGTGLWHDPNAGATNTSGFTSLPGGVRFDDAVFNYQGNVVGFQSSTEMYATTNWLWHMNDINAAVARDNYSKSYGWSVRCLKN
jgi:uncharacterized protein (TIGR02145 family)